MLKLAIVKKAGIYEGISTAEDIAFGGQHGTGGYAFLQLIYRKKKDNRPL
jgi:hypothetical protein